MSIKNSGDSINLGRRLAISYEIVTPESAENADAAERGWYNEEGISMEPDEFDIEDGLSAVDLAAQYLNERSVEPSSSAGWVPGVHYTQYKADEDYSTGAVENRMFHPKGFSPEEEAQILETVQRLAREEQERNRRRLSM